MKLMTLRVKVHRRKTFSRHDKSPKPKFQTSLQLSANRLCKLRACLH